jgi:hypothetical protein
MKKILLLSLLMVSTVAMAGKGETLRDKLVRVHEIYEVNFIHDAALGLDIPSSVEISKGMTLEEVLLYAGFHSYTDETLYKYINKVLSNN